MIRTKIFLISFILFAFSFKSDTNRIKYSDLIAQYKGNVIYVDMWASWCLPCRKNIKKMKSIKEMYKDEKVVFLYITMDLDRNQCATAIEKDGIISDGENYFIIDIEKDEKFREIKTEGSIPHYLIYNKKGELVNTDAPSPKQKKELFMEINKYATE